MANNNTDEKKQMALDYHSSGRPGKIEVVATKPCLTANDLSKAYTPGVAAPCLEIAKDPELAYKYTSKGNLVAVVSNGTAVLGLGDIGALAGKPVMEGKGVLFKRFADIDVFDIEVNENTIDGMVKVVSALEPTFGGINLEDIKAPECFEIEQQLIEKMNIPVFHDDQHGTAIIASAGFINAIEVSKKKINEVKVVFSGAGAAAMACAKLFYKMGVNPANLLMCDSKGVIYKGRTDGMNKYKEEFAVETSDRTLADAMINADAFIGCSARGVLTKEMVATMAKDPIIFAMANPEPEIYPHEAHEVRTDVIMATGRSDFPNQVNNVLGFPFIFRGALDVRATKINDEMKLAAVYALANLAKEEVPEEVKLAYGNEEFSFGREYLIPKPFDTRVLTRLAPAVAKAAMDSGVARHKIYDLKEYASQLEDRLGTNGAFMKGLRDKVSSLVKKRGKKVRTVFAEGSNSRVLQAVKSLLEDDKIEPVLLGNPKSIHNKMEALGLEELKSVEIIKPSKHPKFTEFYTEYCKEKQRNGVSIYHAEDLMSQENYFGSMMVRKGLADSLIAGPTLSYPECMKPILSVVGTKEKKLAAGVYILMFKNRILFFADCTAQINPSAESLCEIANSTADLYRNLMKKEPRIAFLSYSSFGSNNTDDVKKMKKAVQITKEKYPKLKVEGEMQADVAVNHNIMKKLFDFSELDQAADILIFPELNSANISYKLLQQLSDADAIGPILVPMKSSVNIVQRTAPVSEIINMVILNALLALEEETKKEK
ncbi:malate dehydrogenase (oxaloacetate-decarboxylating) (NADP(+)) [Bacteriovorax sp. BSW11_IV]|uniref:NADP-dependent malic enzyme n=1 Tax=Bacteriovorax sp. BSW11_IV TaxID=1353529 RepID=UPI00038A3BDF|nr:NADP-dependent malic enzyme [Bacteriovorax sp. BSW11_IV]EQC49515.1 malate dehydrogenase (oxaloacetate-decarboxylating) (NADP(+)) [Bacteriovorax sp. BSW11_IV]